MVKDDVKIAFISGPGSMNAYIEAGKYLGTMGYLPLNMFSIGFDGKRARDRAGRMKSIRYSCDLLFLLEGWRDCPEAVDEYEEAIFHNRENKRQIAISHPEYRG